MVVGQEYAPVDVAVLVASEHDAGGAPEINVVIAVREAGVPGVFKPNSAERLASQGRNCRKMHLGDVPQPRWRGLPLGALQNKYPHVRDAGGDGPASVVDVRPGNGDLGESAPDLIIGLAAVLHPSLERRETS